MPKTRTGSKKTDVVCTIYRSRDVADVSTGDQIRSVVEEKRFQRDERQLRRIQGIQRRGNESADLAHASKVCVFK